MRKLFLQILVITTPLFSALDIFCQKNTNIDTIETNEFSNEFLLNGKIGTLFIVNSNDSLNNVVVRWSNGYFAIGTIVKGKAFGKWSLFDKKNRQREYLLFGYDAKCVLYSKKISKKGEITSDFKAITPCF